MVLGGGKYAKLRKTDVQAHSAGGGGFGAKEIWTWENWRWENSAVRAKTLWKYLAGFRAKKKFGKNGRLLKKKNAMEFESHVTELIRNLTT